MNVDQAAAILICSLDAASAPRCRPDRVVFPLVALESSFSVPVSQRRDHPPLAGDGGARPAAAEPTSAAPLARDRARRALQLLPRRGARPATGARPADRRRADDHRRRGVRRRTVEQLRAPDDRRDGRAPPRRARDARARVHGERAHEQARPRRVLDATRARTAARRATSPTRPSAPRRAGRGDRRLPRPGAGRGVHGHLRAAWSRCGAPSSPTRPTATAASPRATTPTSRVRRPARS